jgi:hypothetical protein
VEAADIQDQIEGSVIALEARDVGAVELGIDARVTGSSSRHPDG